MARKRGTFPSGEPLACNQRWDGGVEPKVVVEATTGGAEADTAGLGAPAPAWEASEDSEPPEL